jgi:GTP-binding protein YchF
MLKIGIVGLPNAGKSTLFNALVEKGKAQTGKFPFTTIDKNMGVVPVPDSTLVDLAKMANIEKVTQTAITFVDIAGLVKNAHKGEGLGNQFLAHIREVDLILHVVRFFTDETVPHVHSKIDPSEDVAIVETELMLADVESLKKQLEKLKKDKKTKKDEKFIALAEKILPQLNSGKMAKDLVLSEEEKELTKLFHLLTFKPVIYIANVDEKDLKNPEKQIGDKPTLSLCAKFEEELALLPWMEQRQFLKTYELSQSAIESVIERCYHTLEIITFYTIAGGREARAWTIRKGATALEAAGKIHSDFAKHFIKAEIISAPLLLSIGSWAKAHEMGKVALVGRDRLVQDKDVTQFKVGA